MEAPFRIVIEGPPRLRELALARARLLLPEAFEPGGEGAPSVMLSAEVVLEPSALRTAVRSASADGIDLDLVATSAAGGRVAAGKVLVAGARDRRPWEQPVGVAILRRFVDAPLSGPVLNAFAPSFGVSGYGSASRNLLLGMRTLGVDVALQHEWNDIFPDAVDPDEHDRIMALRAPLQHGKPTLFYRPVTNANGTPFLETYRDRRVAGATIAYTMFETDAVPARWPGALNGFDAVWVPTTYNAETFAEAGVDAERIRVVPIALDTAAYTPDGDTLLLAERRTTKFLSIFEWSPRKGADVLLRAWAAAFDPRDDVTLYLRTGSSFEGAEATLDAALTATNLQRADLAPIVLLHQALPGPAYRALFRSVDAFVLTSRGEGFCIPILEAMALGKPVIGTGFGGSADFLDEGVGFPIPARVVPVDELFSRRVPLYRGQRWNDPSVTATAEAMRSIVDYPRDASERAARAFARAHVDYDRVKLAPVAIDALKEVAKPRIRTVIGAVTIAGPAHDDSAGGDATRELLRGVSRLGVDPSLEDSTLIPAAVDQRSADRIGAAQRRPKNGPLVRVDAAGPADVTYLTAWPPSEEQLRDGRMVWVNSEALMRRAMDSGIDASRLRFVPTATDVDFWTPDAADSRDPFGSVLILVADDPNWDQLLISFVRRFAKDDNVTLVIAPGGAIPADPAAVRHVAVGLLSTYAPGGGPTIAIGLPAESPDIRARNFGTHDIALVSEAQSPTTARKLEAMGIPRLNIDDPRLSAAISSSNERWRLGREARLTAQTLARACGARLSDALLEVVELDGPRPAEVAPPRVYIAGGTASSAADVARAWALARFPERDLAKSSHVALVDGGVDMQPGWDATMVTALGMRPNAAIVTTMQRDSNAGLFFAAVFNSEQGIMQESPPDLRGIWLMRRGETRNGPIWIAADAAVHVLETVDEGGS